LAFHSGREADHSPPSSAEVKEWVELYLHSPNTPSWRGAQFGGAQGQLYLIYTLCPRFLVSSGFVKRFHTLSYLPYVITAAPWIERS
jgi:hypothetical protein